MGKIKIEKYVEKLIFLLHTQPYKALQSFIFKTKWLANIYKVSILMNVNFQSKPILMEYKNFKVKILNKYAPVSTV